MGHHENQNRTTNHTAKFQKIFLEPFPSGSHYFERKNVLYIDYGDLTLTLSFTQTQAPLLSLSHNEWRCR